MLKTSNALECCRMCSLLLKQSKQLPPPHLIGYLSMWRSWLGEGIHSSSVNPGQPTFNLAEEIWVLTTKEKNGFLDKTMGHIRSHSFWGGNLKTQQIRLWDFCTFWRHILLLNIVDEKLQHIGQAQGHPWEEVCLGKWEKRRFCGWSFVGKSWSIF